MKNNYNKVCKKYDRLQSYGTDYFREIGNVDPILIKKINPKNSKLWIKLSPKSHVDLNNQH